ncbi:Blue copper protein [Linum perenne]
MASQSIPHKDYFLALILALAIAVTTTPHSVFAETFVVGGDQGWRTGVNFELRIGHSTILFRQNGHLPVFEYTVFKYEKCFHSVARVLSEENYQKCVVPPVSNQLTSGYDVVTLSTEGRKFFVCGIGRNCVDSCQKLAIVVKPHND